jgi:hypothetical protein
MPSATSARTTSRRTARSGIAFVAPLAHERFRQGLAYAHGSVRDQILHLIWVDVFYAYDHPLP